MLPVSSPALCPQRVCALTFLLLFSVLLTTNSDAQIGVVDTDPASGLGGRSTIDGRIFYPSGRSLDKRLRVRLSGVKGEQSTVSDDNGMFTFRRLPAGTYTLTIEAGKEYQPVTETIDLRELLGRRIMTVTIRLQPIESSARKPTVVSAAALESVPKSALKLYQKALASAQKGERQKAIEDLKAALSIHPEFVLGLNELGVQHLRLGQFDEASAAFLSALKIAPDEFSPRLNYGIVLVQQKQFTEAEVELLRAVEKNDTSDIAHLYRGRALIGLGRDVEAEKELQRAIDLKGEAVSLAHRYLGAIYNGRGDNLRAIKELETFLQLAPHDRDADAIRAILKRLKEAVPPR